jgi:hypothetical protein
MNDATLFCPYCEELKPALPHVFGVCVWCAHREGRITGEQLAEYERQGWANGFPTLPHTFREDAINK